MRIFLFSLALLFPILSHSQDKVSILEVENDLKTVLKEFDLKIENEFRDEDSEGVILTVTGIGNKFNLFSKNDNTKIDISLFDQENELKWIYVVFEIYLELNVSKEERFNLINKWSQPASNVNLFWNEKEGHYVVNTTELIVSSSNYKSRLYDKLLSFYGALYQLKNN